MTEGISFDPDKIRRDVRRRIEKKRREARAKRPKPISLLRSTLVYNQPALNVLDPAVTPNILIVEKGCSVLGLKRRTVMQVVSIQSYSQTHVQLTVQVGLGRVGHVKRHVFLVMPSHVQLDRKFALTKTYWSNVLGTRKIRIKVRGVMQGVNAPLHPLLRSVLAFKVKNPRSKLPPTKQDLEQMALNRVQTELRRYMERQWKKKLLSKSGAP